MEAMSIGWIPGITGRHLPIPIVPRCHTKGACSRRNGCLQLLRLSASAVGKSPRISMKISVFRVGEAPFCQFQPRMSRMSRNYNPPMSFAKRRLLPVTPLALSTDRDYRQALEQESLGECKLGSFFPKTVPGYPQSNASKLNWVDPDHEALRSTGSSTMLGNSLAVKHKKSLLPLKGKGRWREMGQLQLKDTRRIMLNPCFRPTFDRLGFQFPQEVSRQIAAGVTVMKPYGTSYVLERSEYHCLIRHESGINVLDQHGFSNSHSTSYDPRKSALFARSMDSRKIPREKTNAKLGMFTRARVGLPGSCSGVIRHGSIRDSSASKFCAGSGVAFREKSRLVHPAHNAIPRRIWSQAHSGVESAGTLFKDLLTIAGLVAFVVYGTYAFAMSQKYLKSGLWFRKLTRSGSAVVASSPRVARKETRTASVKLNPTNVVEITDENFVDTIQKRPTFVLFYATWCPYCLKLDPTWEELGNVLSNKEYNIQLARMNAEKYQSIAANFKVVKYPTLIFFRGGIAVENYLGPRTVSSLVEFVDETLNKPS